MQYKLQSATLCPTSLLISIPRHTLTAVALTFTLTLLAIGRRNTQPRKPFSLPDLVVHANEAPHAKTIL